MKPAELDYAAPTSLDDAIGLLASRDAKILAGGQSLVPLLNLRLAAPELLVDLRSVPGLDGIRRDGDDLVIGATVRQRRAERDATIREVAPLVAEALRHVGHPQIRSRGTIGGSIAHADPAAEWCLLAVLLNARIVLTGPAGERTVPAAGFFEGYYSTAAGPDKMITELWFPEPAPAAALTEFAPRQGDFAVVAAAVSADIADGTCRSGRVVLGGVGPRPVEVDAGPLTGQPASAETWRAMGEHAAGQVDPPPASPSPFPDSHGDAGFRRRLTATLVTRALEETSRQVHQ
jgi:aerobic carbon-monoxide dehydrogenase medium subunit